MRTFIGFGAAIAVMALAAGCERDRSNTTVQKQISDAMNQTDGLKGVTTEVHDNTIVLKGDVSSMELKTRAETLARRNAPGYNVENRINVPAAHSSAAPERTTERVKD